MFQSSLTYRDARLAGLDTAVLMEVIEHVDPDRLSALERAVFGFAAPGAVFTRGGAAGWAAGNPASARLGGAA